MPFLKYIIRKTFTLLSNTDDPWKGDALIGFRQTISGAVPGTVHGKLTEMVCVKDFGAVGDGTDPD